MATKNAEKSVTAEKSTEKSPEKSTKIIKVSAVVSFASKYGIYERGRSYEIPEPVFRDWEQAGLVKKE